MNFEKAYEEALAKAREIHRNEKGKRFDMEWLFPELAGSEDEKIIKILQEGVNNVLQDQFCTNRGVSKEKILSWLEKQDEQKPNPYSGTSFEYNGHTWGMCARDNGVDILCDKHIIGHLDKQG